MPKTLLAVDDSATMRKVLEITFGGEDFRVVTADGPDEGARPDRARSPSRSSSTPSLGGEDGYALAQGHPRRATRAPPSSSWRAATTRTTPRAARAPGADDYIDKPFDTQALIDKVKKAIGRARASGRARRPRRPRRCAARRRRRLLRRATAASPGPSHTPAPRRWPPGRAAARSPAAAHAHAQLRGRAAARRRPRAAPPAAPAPSPASPVARTAPSGVPCAASGRRSAPAGAPPPRRSRAPVAPAGAAAGARACAARRASGLAGRSGVNGQLAGKLGDLGLSPAQVDAVLALSREVVERVVWEVVPQLAETIIKEEIARLTKEG